MFNHPHSCLFLIVKIIYSHFIFLHALRTHTYTTHTHTTHTHPHTHTCTHSHTHTHNTHNCSLDADYIVKVGDSALSKELFPECYCEILGAVRPVRWSAPETLQEGLCTIKSNVVSVLPPSLGSHEARVTNTIHMLGNS